jgi:hypothetical protein
MLVRGAWSFSRTLRVALAALPFLSPQLGKAVPNRTSSGPPAFKLSGVQKLSLRSRVANRAVFAAP